MIKETYGVMAHPDSIATTLLPGVRVSVLIGFQPKAAKSYVSMILIRYAAHHIPMRACIFPYFEHSEGSHGSFIVSTIAHNIQEFSIFNRGGITLKN